MRQKSKIRPQGTVPVITVDYSEWILRYSTFTVLSALSSPDFDRDISTVDLYIPLPMISRASYPKGFL